MNANTPDMVEELFELRCRFSLGFLAQPKAMESVNEWKRIRDVRKFENLAGIPGFNDRSRSIAVRRALEGFGKSSLIVICDLKAIVS